MKNFCGIADLFGNQPGCRTSLLFLFVFCASCASFSAPVPTADYSDPHTSSFSDASADFSDASIDFSDASADFSDASTDFNNAPDDAFYGKDYTILGVVFLNSTDAADANGNYTGSNITNETIMLEAQKLGADNVINVENDANSATAVAIKYTAVLAVEGVVENNSAVNQNDLAKTAVPAAPPPEKKSANVRKNWLSVGPTLAGFDFKWERMLHRKWSLGTDAYFQSFGFSNGFSSSEFGVEGTVRYYPFGKVLYMGLGLGIHGYEYEYLTQGRYTWSDKISNNDYAVGFGITPELGVKIDAGAAGGFFMDIGLKIPLIFGGREDGVFSFNVVPCIGFGKAF